MPTVLRNARVAHSAAQMFDLVNDVEAYPRFLHWCRGARIESRGADTLEATLDIGIGGVHKSFRTRNTLDRPNSIRLELVSGPFRRLEGEWRFRDVDGGGSDVTLSLRFEAAASVFGMLFSQLFEELCRSQVNAFIARADELYGR